MDILGTKLETKSRERQFAQPVYWNRLKECIKYE